MNEQTKLDLTRCLAYARIDYDLVGHVTEETAYKLWQFHHNLRGSEFWPVVDDYCSYRFRDVVETTLSAQYVIRGV